ncbi:hypothetical protein [Streptomyces sp. NPDC004830]
MSWNHSVLSAGQVKAAAGTSPTSWYTANDDVQHIAYVGTDQEIHEVFFRFTPGGLHWEYSIPSAGQINASSRTSPTSWYTPNDDVQHIAYVGTDQEIHEVFFRFTPGGLHWEHNIPSAGQEKAAAGTSPTSWVTPADNVQHIAYVGADQQIHEAFFRFTPEGLHWEHNIPSAGHVKVAAGTNPTSWYTANDDVQHIAYVGTDQQIHETFFRFTPGGLRWEHSIPSAGQEKAAAGTSPTGWVTRIDSVQHIAYIGLDQQIHEAFFRFTPGGLRWEHSIPSAGQEKAAAGAGTRPTSWVTRSDSVQHIAYIGLDQQIHETFFRFTPGGLRWEHNIPSAGHMKVAAGTSPTSWITRSDNVQHIAYVGTDHQIQEAFLRLPGEDLSLDYFTFAGDISAANREKLIDRHRFALSRVSGCNNLSSEERRRLRQTYNRPIYHTTLNKPNTNGNARVGGSQLNVNFGVLFPQGDEEISQTLIHEMMHCAGFTHPTRRDPPRGSSCAAPNPVVFDCPNDNGVYYGTPPLRAEFCIAGDQNDVISRLESKAGEESCVIGEDGVATIHTTI